MVMTAALAAAVAVSIGQVTPLVPISVGTPTGAGLVPLGASITGWHFAPGMRFEGYDITTFPADELDVLAAKAWCFADQRCAGFYYGKSEVHMKASVPLQSMWQREADSAAFGGVYVKPQCTTPMHPHPTQGDYSISGSGFEAVVHYLCRPGLLMVGTRTRHCLPQTNPITGVRTGYWSGTEPQCEPDPCSEDPPPFDHGSVHVVTRPSGLRVAEYSCDPGFALVGIADVGGVATRSCSDGLWLNSFSTFADSHTENARCVQSCGHMPSFAFGRFAANSFVEGGRATFTCDPLYTLESGSVHWQCQHGIWAPVMTAADADADAAALRPVCRPVGCAPPLRADIARGLVLVTARIQDNLHYPVGLALSLRCSHGYRHFGMRSTTCQADGTWTAPFSAECEPATLCDDITCDAKHHRVSTHRCASDAAWCRRPAFVRHVGSADGDPQQPLHHFEVHHSTTSDQLVPDRHHHCAMEGSGSARRCRCYCWQKPTGAVDRAAQQWGWAMTPTSSTQL